MKTLLVLVLVFGLASSSFARSMQYPPQPAPTAPAGNSSSGSNIVPIVAIAGAVITAGVILFKVKKAKTARAARFNVYAFNQEARHGR